MLGQAKPFASLSSTLLARKGQARPAMRPQGFASLAPSAAALEDLGWNDMGAETAPIAAPEPVAFEPVAAEPVQPTPIAPSVEPIAEPAPPPVLAEREALREELETPVAPVAVAPETPAIVRSVSVATASRLQRETAHTGRAAFTLRLDAQRHLKLRIASALAHRSAQQLVSHALDQFLTTLPEVEALVAQLPDTPAPKRKRR